MLHEVFDFDYADIAHIIGKSDTNSRQIVSRARKTLGGGRSRFVAPESEVRVIVERFMEAARSGEFAHLLELLAPDVVLYADGGAERPRYGKIRAYSSHFAGAITLRSS